jgi:predicted aspartyl protease
VTEIECGFESGDDGQGQLLLARTGPTLLVDIGFDKTWNLQSGGTPSPGVTGVKALVDTGASESCIDQILAANLGLPIVDRRPISGSHGAHDTNMYLAQIHVPGVNFTIFGVFAGVDLKDGGQVHEALIGRTFLQRFHMTYNGNSGSVVLKRLA